MVHELPCCGLSEIERPLDPGWIDWTPELPRTLSWLRWRTSWHASHGPYYRAEKTIAHYRASLQRERADPVTAPLQRIKGLPTEVCTGTARTKEQSQRRAFNLIPKMVSNDRPTCKDRHAAELIMARRNDLHSKTEYIAADFLRLDTFPLQSCGGPYIAGIWIGPRTRVVCGGGDEPHGGNPVGDHCVCQSDEAGWRVGFDRSGQAGRYGFGRGEHAGKDQRYSTCGERDNERPDV